jgi:GntR family transcriptional regulator
MSEWITSSTPYLAPRGETAPDPWKEEAARAGHVGGHRLILVEKQTPPDHVCRLLGTEPQTPAILRRRIVTVDDRPVEVADSWYQAAIADGTPLAEARPIRGGALRALAELGYTAVRHIENIAVTDPPATLREFLGDGAVLELTRTSYTQTGEPFEVAVMLMSRDMAPGVPRRLQYELRTT